MNRITLRFLFIYFLLFTSPIYWFYRIPGLSHAGEYYFEAESWIVHVVNKYLLHIKDELNIDGGGSGDTSYSWALFYTSIILAAFGALIWSVVDRKRKTSYRTLDFILRNIVRYYVALTAFLYGVIKLFVLQMPFPNLSQLATPLGDYLPMRLSWMFLGYSSTYQIFSGVMELAVALLLLYRKTVTFGALLGAGVFTNVFILNISYDIPVKLYSMQLLISCVFLIALDWKRCLNFFVLNKPAEPTDAYEFPATRKWQRIGRIVWKIAFVVLFIIIPFNDTLNRYEIVNSATEVKPVRMGVYSIQKFAVNGDTTLISYSDDYAWKDFIFDKGGMGSVNTIDTLFRQRYRRGYFIYQPDTLSQSIKFKRAAQDSLDLFVMNYRMPDEHTIELSGQVREDSLYFLLRRTNRHFQLAERQFHWISEANR